MTRTVLICAIALGATALAAPVHTADAQPGNYAEPPPPAPIPPPYVRPPVRRGLTIGFDLGLGSMEAASGPICDGCQDQPAGSLGFWIGAMINPRFALMFQGSITGQAIDETGDASLVNTTGLIAGKLWLSPRLWLKAGVGFASLSLSDRGQDEPLDEGGAGMLGIGFEAVHSLKFSMDISLTATSSTFDAIDEEISTGILNLGFNWY